MQLQEEQSLPLHQEATALSLKVILFQSLVGAVAAAAAIIGLLLRPQVHSRLPTSVSIFARADGGPRSRVCAR